MSRTRFTARRRRRPRRDASRFAIPSLVFGNQRHAFFEQSHLSIVRVLFSAWSPMTLFPQSQFSIFPGVIRCLAGVACFMKFEESPSSDCLLLASLLFQLSHLNLIAVFAYADAQIASFFEHSSNSIRRAGEIAKCRNQVIAQSEGCVR